MKRGPFFYFVYGIYRDLKYVYLLPAIYKRASKKPIVKDKAVFVEFRLDKISNSIRLLYDRLDKEGYKLSCHFLRKGFVGEIKHTINAIKYVKDAATAQIVVFDEGSEVAGCIKKRQSQKIINTWHGCGAFKRFGFSTVGMIFGDKMQNLLKYPSHPDYDMVTVSSDEVRWAYIEAMHKEDNPGCIKDVGISRTDVFFDDEYLKDARRRLLDAIPAAQGKKIILYAPTFRGRVSSAKAPDKLNIAMMKEALSDEYILLIKHHPVVKVRPKIDKECSDFAFDVSDDLGIEELIINADICISDYSSLIFEYSLFERPMIFFAYDKAEFDDWRGFYYDYDELTPGPVFEENEEIIDYILHIDDKFDINEVRAFKKKFMSACDGHATDRIMEFIKR